MPLKPAQGNIQPIQRGARHKPNTQFFLLLGRRDQLLQVFVEIHHAPNLGILKILSPAFLIYVNHEWRAALNDNFGKA